MLCPSCRSQNDDFAAACFVCGTSMGGAASIHRGSIVVSRYEILEVLGKGGMGVVYKAHDRVLDEKVALKLLRSDVASAPDIARRFRSEIKLARRVRHKNVCGIHEYGEEGSLRFISMEYIQGVDLRRVLHEKGVPSPEEAFEICIQIADGLHAIHDAGIIHRDLKTPNIMRDERGTIRLMDFGIAKQAGAEATLGATALGMIIGTPEYMSPEQARGEKIDFRSDIYALGIVVFEVFTGDVPFRGETPLATIFKHLQDPPPLDGPKARSLPAAVVPLLRKALAKAADERFATATELADGLRQARRQSFPASAQGVVPASFRGATALAPERVPTPAPVRSPSPLPRTPLPTPVPTAVPTHVPTPVPSATAGRSAPPRGVPPVRPQSDATAHLPLRAEEEVSPLPPARVPHAPPPRPAFAVPTPRPMAAPTAPRRPVVPAPRPRALLAVAGAAVALVLGLMVWMMVRGRGSASRDAAAPMTESSNALGTSASRAPEPPGPEPATALGAGAVVIDAVPWAEVVAIVDEKGGSHSPGSTRFTPIVVGLPPGDYAISLRHPGARDPVTLKVTVKAAHVSRPAVVEFGRIDAAEYLRQAGL